MPTIQQLVRKGREVLVEKSKSPALDSCPDVYKRQKLADKALLPKIDDEFESKVADLKRILVKKLMTLTEGKVSQGVKDYLGAEVIAKGSKFSVSDFDLSLIHILLPIQETILFLSFWTIILIRRVIPSMIV